MHSITSCVLLQKSGVHLQQWFQPRSSHHHHHLKRQLTFLRQMMMRKGKMSLQHHRNLKMLYPQLKHRNQNQSFHFPPTVT